jgi:hypothetical protein
VGGERWFYRDEADWGEIAERIKRSPCPFCKRVGMLVRHGCLFGFDEGGAERVVRAKRIFCSNRNRRTGCGRTFSVWLADKIRRVSLTTQAVGRFLERAAAVGVAAAIRVADSSRSGRTWQRIWRRFRLGQSAIRTALLGRCPATPLPANAARRPTEAQVLAHLRAAFPNDDCPIAAFQHACRSFFV